MSDSKIKFEAGKSYILTIPTAGEGEYECKVISRSPSGKSVVIETAGMGRKRVKIYNFSNEYEEIHPGAAMVCANELWEAR